MKARTSVAKVEVRADGEGLVSHAGAALLGELADLTGLTQALSAVLAPSRERAGIHDPGVVLRDLAISIADGGECVSDLGALRDQPDLFGNVASESTAHRAIDAATEVGLEAVRTARARARARAWAAGARPSELILDIDATLLGSHSEKEGAAGNYKGGYGFHPLLCYLDETGEPLAALLRPGNAGANTAADHFEVLSRALEQIPASDLGREISVRTDAGGASHAFLADCREAGIGFSVGYELTPALREAILAAPESAWEQAIEPDGCAREGAWVIELTDSVELASWPEGTRLICRRERAHPGAQFSFTDHAGHRFTSFLTDSAGDDIAALELRHRRRARVEDRIRTAKETGMANLPFHDFAANEVWAELSLMAQELLAFTRSLCLEGDLALAEPKRLRYVLLHVAGRIARSGRRVVLRLPRGWPWAEALVAAFARLRALPALAGP